MPHEILHISVPETLMCRESLGGGDVLRLFRVA
jgi:hypothetical protein